MSLTCVWFLLFSRNNKLLYSPLTTILGPTLKRENIWVGTNQTLGPSNWRWTFTTSSSRTWETLRRRLLGGSNGELGILCSPCGHCIGQSASIVRTGRSAYIQAWAFRRRIQALFGTFWNTTINQSLTFGRQRFQIHSACLKEATLSIIPQHLWQLSPAKWTDIFTEASVVEIWSFSFESASMVL